MRQEKLQLVKIRDMGKVITGKTPSTSRQELFGNEYPFITPSDIDSFDVRYMLETNRGISELGKQSQKNYLLPPNAVCYVCIGSTIGKMCMTANYSFTNQQINSIIINNNFFNANYVFYLLKSITPYIQSISGGTGAGKNILNKTSFEDIEVLVHSLNVQKKIASILSAYDALIENNLRRIKILEEMTKRIYQEWFVHFRFPGHENITMVKSELGLIPKGWSVTRFSDALQINPRLQLQANKMHPFVDMAGLSTDGMLIQNVTNKIGNNGSKFQNGDTLFARITPCLENGKTGFVQCLLEGQIGLGSTEFIVLRSTSLTPEYVYLLARSDAVRNVAIKSMTGASGRQRVKQECFDNIFIAHPTRDVLTKFTKVVKPMFSTIQTYAVKNTNLRKTRDLLLPRLILGEVDVEDLDIAISEEGE